MNDDIAEYERLKAKLEKSPGDLEDQSRLADVCFRLGHLEEAGNIFTKILEDNPTDLDALLGLGGIYGSQGEREISEEYFKKALKIEPDCVVALYYLGVLSEEVGDYRGAEQYYRRAVEIDSSYPPLLPALASIVGEQGKVEESIAILESIPDSLRDEFYYELRGVAHYHNREFDLAKCAYEEILKLTNDNLDARRWLGYCLLELGDFDAAEQHIRTYVLGVATATGSFSEVPEMKELLSFLDQSPKQAELAAWIRSLAVQ